MNLKDLKSLSKKQWLIAIAAITIVVSGFLLWRTSLALNRLGPDEGVPSFLRRDGDESSLWAVINQTNLQIAEQNALASKISVVKAQLAAMQADIEAARKRLPTDSQKSEMRQLIEGLGRRVGAGANPLVIKSVQIRVAANGTGRRGAVGDYQMVEYNLQIQSDMDGVIQFINLIESHERFMTVDSMQLSTGGVTVDAKTNKVEFKPHSISLKILTYIDTGSKR